MAQIVGFGLYTKNCKHVVRVYDDYLEITRVYNHDQ